MKGQSKNFLENRKLALIVLVLLCVFSVFVMGPTKLKNLRNEALQVFRSGTHDGYTLSVYTDVRGAGENANRLASAAEAALGENDEQILTLKALSEEILSSDDPETMLTAFSALARTADSVYIRLSDANASENAMEQARQASANILSASNTIEKDEYFALAQNFNEKRSGFPASLLAWLSGADALYTGGK